MIGQLADALNDKTTSQYKVIEDRYLTLVRWLKLKLKDDNYITKEEVLTIIKALSEDPIEEIDKLVEEETNEYK